LTGFTTITPTMTTTQLAQQGSGYSGTGTRFVYVANSGSGGNPGTQLLPVATAAQGLALMRAGFPDWLLFNCGDTWTNDPINGDLYGKSTTELMLFGNYGSGARPLFRLPLSTNGLSFLANATTRDHNGSNIAVIGLEFYGYQKDPSSPSYAGSASAATGTGTGIRIIVGDIATTLTSTLNIIEDCKVTFFGDSLISCQAYTSNTLIPNSTLQVRRNILSDSFVSGPHTQGMYTQGWVMALVEENLFDYGGWSPDAALSAAGCGRNVFNRNYYVHEETGCTMRFIGNMSCHSSSEGVQNRTGGTAYCVDNFFFQNPTGFDLGHRITDNGVVTTAATVKRNVVINAASAPSGGQGAGMNFAYCQGSAGAVTMDSCIFAHDTSSYAFSCAITFDPDCQNVAVTNCIVFNWHFSCNDQAVADSGLTVQNYGPGATGDSMALACYDQTGTNAGGPPEPFSHPSPTFGGSNDLLADYYVSIGGTNSSTAFLTAAKARAWGTWPQNLTAYAVNSYIQAGFNVAYRSDSSGLGTITIRKVHSVKVSKTG